MAMSISCMALAVYFRPCPKSSSMRSASIGFSSMLSLLSYIVRYNCKHNAAQNQTFFLKRKNMVRLRLPKMKIHVYNLILESRCRSKLNAQVAELVDAHGSGPCAARCRGSSHLLGTKPLKEPVVERQLAVGFVPPSKQGASAPCARTRKAGHDRRYSFTHDGRSWRYTAVFESRPRT